MTALWITLAAVGGYLLIGWIGATTWMRGLGDDSDPAQRGMNIAFALPIGILGLLVLTCDGLVKATNGALGLLGRTVPRGR